jgi:hypothetical protein
VLPASTKPFSAVEQEASPHVLGVRGMAAITALHEDGTDAPLEELLGGSVRIGGRGEQAEAEGESDHGVAGFRHSGSTIS